MNFHEKVVRASRIQRLLELIMIHGEVANQSKDNVLKGLREKWNATHRRQKQKTETAKSSPYNGVMAFAFAFAVIWLISIIPIIRMYNSRKTTGIVTHYTLCPHGKIWCYGYHKHISEHVLNKWRSSNTDASGVKYFYNIGSMPSVSRAQTTQSSSKKLSKRCKATTTILTTK